MSDRGTMAALLRDTISAKVGDTLPSSTRVLLQVAPEQVIPEQGQQLVAVSAMLSADTAEESREIGKVRQAESWEWYVYVIVAGGISAAGSSTHDAGVERGWSMIEAIRDVLCPAAGLRLDSKCQDLNYAETRYLGFTSTGALVWRSIYRHGRYRGA